MDRKALGRLSYGVYIVSTVDGARPTGCVANSVMQITSTPITVAASICHDNFTREAIAESGKFAVSVLAQDTDSSIVGRFGFSSGRDGDKFDGVAYTTVEGLPVLKDACAYIVCRVVNVVETSTHTVFIGEATAASVQDERTPMTYAYYREVVKGKSPRNAPTFVPEQTAESAPAQKQKYRCQVCGYVYEGDELPTGYTCPICGVPATRFTKV